MQIVITNSEQETEATVFSRLGLLLYSGLICRSPLIISVRRFSPAASCQWSPARSAWF